MCLIVITTFFFSMKQQKRKLDQSLVSKLFLKLSCNLQLYDFCSCIYNLLRSDSWKCNIFRHWIRPCIFGGSHKKRNLFIFFLFPCHIWWKYRINEKYLDWFIKRNQETIEMWFLIIFMKLTLFKKVILAKGHMYSY